MKAAAPVQLKVDANAWTLHEVFKGEEQLSVSLMVLERSYSNIDIPCYIRHLRLEKSFSKGLEATVRPRMAKTAEPDVYGQYCS
jgi:hypothetical protein